MAGKRGRSGRPRKQQFEVRQQNILKSEQLINEFLNAPEIPIADKMDISSKLVIKDMHIQAQKDIGKKLTQNNFFTQIINRAAEECRQISDTPMSKVIEVSAQQIEDTAY
ncbi:hypothetical protein ACFL3D_01880 [Candidatus Omnitrophota bacterium]